jgi:hypothetical protein
MSDPRIYHRVGPTAPEGRQIYDDIRRRNAVLNGEIDTVSGSVTSLSSTVTALENQLNNLSAAVTVIGETDETSKSVSFTSSGIGSSLTDVSVTPTVAAPFMLYINGFLDTNDDKIMTGTIRETTGGATTAIKTLFTGFDTNQSGRDGPVPFVNQMLISNTATTTRTFALYLDLTTSVGSGTYFGQMQAVQWTVS